MTRRSIIFRLLLLTLVPQFTQNSGPWAEDCNANLVDDTTDIAQGTALDCNMNGVPDWCDLHNPQNLRLDLVQRIPAQIDQSCDYDLDSYPDLLLGNYAYRNNGDGTFAALTGPHTLPQCTAAVPFCTHKSVNFVDLNNDSNEDRVSFGRDHITVELGDGTGRYIAADYPSPVPFCPGLSSYYTFLDISINDFDNDNDLDIAVLMRYDALYCPGSGRDDILSLILYRNQGSGLFDAGTVFPGRQDQNNIICVDDFNHDTYLDVSYGSPTDAIIAFNDGDAGFDRSISSLLPPLPYPWDPNIDAFYPDFIFVDGFVDMDNDGDWDLIGSVSYRRCDFGMSCYDFGGIWLNVFDSWRQEFRSRLLVLLGREEYPYVQFIDDFDLDGDPDAATTGLSYPPGTTEPFTVISHSTNTPSRDCDLNAVPDECQQDFDNDGLIDTCDDDDDDDGTIDVDDCLPFDPMVFPGAAQVCDRQNNDCSSKLWPSIPFDEIDNDSDGFTECEGDCDDADPTIFPDAHEVNDGMDNGCPGDEGAGIIDELTGGIWLTAAKALCWSPQLNATSYEILVSGTTGFSGACSSEVVLAPCYFTPSTPNPGDVTYFLVHALTPFSGSLGRNSQGAERLINCP